MSALPRLRPLLVVTGVLLGGCAGAGGAPAGTPPTAATALAARHDSPLPQLLAVAACPEIEDRLVTLATGSDGILDAFVLVRRCEAHVVEKEVALTGDAWAWVAVDRDLGAVRVRQFVHASLHADLRVGARARYEGDHLELTLAPKPGAKASMEPVGLLELSPLNWASLLAVELAPAMGTSAEWVAKRRLREETEAAIDAALARPVVFAFDARRGESWVVGSSSAPGAGAGAGPGAGAGAVPRLRVVPRGTALLGPYPESAAAPDVHLRLEPGARVAVRTVCRSHAERILEADRRGEAVNVEEWVTASGDAHPALPPTACPWMLALRALDEPGAVVTTEVRAPRGDASAAERGRRWVALDALALEDPAEVPADLEVVVSSDVYRRSLVPPAKSKLPAVLALSTDDAVWVRAERPGIAPAPPTVVARVRLPLDEVRDVDQVLELALSGGRVGRVRIRARVRAAPPVETP